MKIDKILKVLDLIISGILIFLTSYLLLYKKYDIYMFASIMFSISFLIKGIIYIRKKEFLMGIFSMSTSFIITFIILLSIIN
jgi:hypothetical protein